MRVFVTMMLLLVTGLLQAEQGLIVRSAMLRADSSYLAKTIAKLPPGTDVQVLERKGGWQKISVQKKSASTGVSQPLSGWIRGYQVRVNLIKQSSDRSVSVAEKEGGVLTGLSSLSRSTASLFGRNQTQNQSGVVATIGVRGLSEQDLANAKPDMQELSLLRQYATDDKQVKRFAKAAKLKSHKVAELADPDKQQKRKKKRKKKDKG